MIGAVVLVAIGVQPPNGRAAVALVGMLALLGVAWFGGVRRRFAGPPAGLLASDGDRPGEPKGRAKS